MRKLLLLSLAVVLAMPFSSHADEGMWLPMLIKRLNYQDMQDKGLQLTPEEIYSVNNSSLKDAIVNFGNFCTGEIISPDGLILTNHHCGYDAIRSHSTPENDILTNGFWAYERDQEKPNAGLSVTFLVRMADVTERVLAELNDEMSEDERDAKVKEISGTIIEEEKGDSHYKVEVKSFFEGNEYYMFVYEVFTDVRLVGAPPASVGKYGGDTDNWMWPRHTGDFSMFRVYMGPDGKPADYSEDNVPYKPKHFLPINVSGVENGDYAMIMGYPGSTDRYMTSFGIEEAMNVGNAPKIMLMGTKLDIMKKYMDMDDQTRIDYASTYASTANYWKYLIGQTEQLRKNRVSEKKQKMEAKFSKWVNQEDSRQMAYGSALSEIEAAYKSMEPTVLANSFLNFGVFGGASINAFSYVGTRWEPLLEAGDEASLEQIRQMGAGMGAQQFAEYNMEMDREIYATMMMLIDEKLSSAYKPAYFEEIKAKYKGDWNAFADMVYDKSIFASEENFNAFLEKPKLKTLQRDPALLMMNELYGFYRENVSPIRKEAFDQLDKGSRQFIAGLREMHPDKSFYPDANFTMRLTYGTIGDYDAADAVHYDYFTTANGILQKWNPNDEEFVLPEKLIDLLEARDYGRWADDDGELRVCFISNNDITGGNSGSPVINGKGELIGCAFDGNWEAMSGDIFFENTIQRTISVDIRYVLFIVDKYAGAQNLIDEMTLVERVEEIPAEEAVETSELPALEE
jgi:hypothetical protein